MTTLECTRLSPLALVLLRPGRLVTTVPQTRLRLNSLYWDFSSKYADRNRPKCHCFLGDTTDLWELVLDWNKSEGAGAAQELGGLGRLELGGRVLWRAD